MDKALEDLASCLDDTWDVLSGIPECARNESWSESKNRLTTGKKKLGILREVIRRDHIKVAFFGRTSSGKSSVINALLGESILPRGLGRTTGCFVEIRGTAEASPCLLLPKPNNEFDLVEVEPSSISTVVSSLSTRSFGPDTSVMLLWPRGLCSIFQESEVVLLDSPGIDVEGDCDGWIDRFCVDADLFVWVVNGESTVNVKEKEFFRRVAAAISQPNILVLVNRWDCTSEEEEYFIHAAHSQHVDRTCDLLVSRLGVAQSVEEARKRMFFVSAKEVTDAQRRTQDPASSPHDTGCSIQKRLMQERKEEWDRFVASILSCVNASARTNLRFLPHVETSLSITRQTIRDIEVLEATCSKILVDEMEPCRNKLEGSIKALEVGMESLTEELKKEISQLLQESEASAESAFDAEVIAGLTAAVNGFEAVMHDDPVNAVVFKERLRRHVEDAVTSGLLTRLNREVCARVDATQQGIVDRVRHVIPQEKRDFTQDITSRRMPMDLAFIIGAANLGSFMPDLSFKSSFSPRRLVACYAAARRKMLSFLGGNASGISLRRIAAAASVGTSEVSSAAAAALIVKWIKGIPNFRPVFLSCCLALATAAVTERLLWTAPAKEKELRRQFLEYALRRMTPMRATLTSHCRAAAQKELTSTLVLAVGAAEGAGCELRREFKQASQDCVELEKSSKGAKAVLKEALLLEMLLKELRLHHL